MTRYSVTVIRTLRKAQWRDVTIEAECETDAKAFALIAADGVTFWNNARTHPLPSDEPEIDSIWTAEDTMS